MNLIVMNKLMGFYELKSSGLPTIHWEEYEPGIQLDETRLWTIRSAVYQGIDISLPRVVGATAKEAKSFAVNLRHKLGDNGMIVYYPYFIAEKSGTLNLHKDKYIIEAVTGDLWNLVTESKIDVSITKSTADKTILSASGNKDFLTTNEISLIEKHIPEIRLMFKDYMTTNETALLEWSYAYDTDINKNKLGDKYLVFYEARTV